MLEVLWNAREVTPPHTHSCGMGVVAIPANNEADRIAACLSALAVQRDVNGAPVETGQFEVIIFANNCSDATVSVVTGLAQTLPFAVSVIENVLPAAYANAGWARKLAMDAAARLLTERGQTDGIILTTDADSCVSPTWFSATKSAFQKGADCVAGYIDAHPLEITGLGPAFLARGRLEDRYLSQIAEIYAICDPRAHDPWPNHRVSSGASLAIRLDAYLAVGGLPPRPVGEDAALTQVLEQAGYRVRHTMAVSVSTSCRFDGRAKGGAADTMHYRHTVIDAPCDDDLEDVLALIRRASTRGKLRRASNRGLLLLNSDVWARKLGLDLGEFQSLVTRHTDTAFSTFWDAVQQISPQLAREKQLLPSALPEQIRQAERALRLLRALRI